ncbi:MAG TPA: hypothetical protein ENG95_05905 [Nitrospirae bacterium]|nr:hypothetical protein [Nitrospirota bacterium]
MAGLISVMHISRICEKSKSKERPIGVLSPKDKIKEPGSLNLLASFILSGLNRFLPEQMKNEIMLMYALLWEIGTQGTRPLSKPSIPRRQVRIPVTGLITGNAFLRYSLKYGD